MPENERWRRKVTGIRVKREERTASVDSLGPLLHLSLPPPHFLARVTPLTFFTIVLFAFALLSCSSTSVPGILEHFRSVEGSGRGHGGEF